MTEPRIIQNFVGYRAMIVTDAPAAVSQLESTLSKIGLSISYPDVENGSFLLRDDMITDDQAVLFIDSDMNVFIESPGHDRLPHVPVIGIVGVEAPSRLKSLMRLGATATLRKPVYGGSVYSALYIGVNEFRRRRALMLQLDEQERRRRGRRHLMKAIVAVMKSTGCDEDVAYDRLRRESMRQRLSVEDYCESFMRALPGVHESDPGVQGMTCADKSK